MVYGEKGKYPEDFAVGMLAATLYVFLTNAPEKDRYLKIMQRLSPALGIGAVVFFVYLAMRFYSLGTPYNWPLLPGLFRIFPWSFDQEIDFALCYGCLMMAALFNRPGGLFRRVFEWSPLRWLGTLSFSLYIWHDAFISSIQYNVVPGLHSINRYEAIMLTWILAASIIFPFCFLMYGIIEKPGMRLSERLRKQMLLKKRSQVPDASFPQNPLPQMVSREQVLAFQNHRGSDKSPQESVVMEWLPTNPNQDLQKPGWAPPQAASRMTRSKHRLQPLPGRETDTF